MTGPGTTTEVVKLGACTPMFGRDDVYATVMASMADPAVRLLTLTGRGGVGKTRLAAEVARELIARAWPTTVVTLARVSNVDLVVSEIAVALGVPPASTGDADDVVAARLGGDDHLLVLDNLEHVAEVTPRLSTLLDRCRGLRILATSQAPLRLRHEHVVRIEPLVLPAVDQRDRTPEVDLSEPAIATYLAAARSADAGFVLDDHEQIAVVELCRRLEGLPLAIELAGARAATLRPTDMVRSLDEVGIDVLSRPRGDDPERHHDVSAAIAWSYELLPAAEQRLLGILSVGAGSFSLDTVLAAAEVTPSEAIDHLSSLVDLHLVDRSPGRHLSCYTIANSIREYALGRAARAGELDAMRRRFVAGWASQAHAAAERIEAGVSGVALAVEMGDDGLGAALEVALDDGLTDDALDIVRVLAERWDTHGYHRVHEVQLERCLALAERADGDPIRQARASTWSAMVGLRHASTRSKNELLDRLRRAEAVGEQTDDDGTILFALTVRMLILPITHDTQEASRAASRALELAARPTNADWLGSIRVWAGMVAYQEGELDRALELGRAALDDARAAGDRGALVQATLLLGPLTAARPELLADVPSTEQALAFARDAGQPFYEAILQVRLVAESVASGDGHGALVRAEQSLLMARAMVGSPFVGFQLLEACSALAINNDPSTAARLHGVLRPMLPFLDAYDPPAHRAARDVQLDGLRAALGEDAFESEAANGAGMAWADAVELALDAVREGLGRDEHLLDAVHAVEREQPFTGAQALAVPTVHLTDRQGEVLRLLAGGKSNKDIAGELGISAKTVMHHTMAIYRHLGVRGRNEATAWAYRSGFLDGAQTDALPDAG